MAKAYADLKQLDKAVKHQLLAEQKSGDLHTYHQNKTKEALATYQSALAP